VPALRDVVFTPAELCLVFDHGGAPILNCLDYRSNCSPAGLAWNRALGRAAVKTLVEVLSRLHAGGFSYNDLKPQQLLAVGNRAVGEVHSVALVDFGAGEVLSEEWPAL
jgi:serine/threonine protein kinase